MSDDTIAVKQNPKGGLSLTDKVALDPTQTDSILENMQRFIDERQGPMNQLMRGLKSAYSVTGGPSAIAAYDREKSLEDKDVMDYRTQMAAYRAAQAQSAGDAEFMKNFTGGGAGATPGGVELGPEALERIRSYRNPSEQRAALQEELKALSSARAKSQFDAASNKPEKYFWPGKGYVDMTPNMLINLPPVLRRQIEEATLKQLGYVPGTPSAPAAPTAAPAAPTAAPTRPVATAGADGVIPSAGNATALASALDLPLISGDRDTTKQTQLFNASQVPGYKGPPVARPGTSKHEFGNAIDIDTKSLTPEQRTMLNQAGFVQPFPEKDPNHWELSGAKIGEKLTAAPAEVVRPAAPAAPAEVVRPAAPTAAAPAPAAEAAKPAEKAPVSKVPPPVGAAPFVGSAGAVSNLPEFNEPAPDPKKFGSSTDYESAKATWEKRRDAALAAATKFQEQVGGESAKAFADAEKNFVTLTDQKKLGAREVTTNQLNGWLKQWGENPRVLEVMSKPTFANAVADALQQGVTLSAAGTLSIPGIERIIQSSMPGLKGDEVTALKQLSAIMGPRILQIVEQSKGSSSDKDWAAFSQIAGNSSSGYDFLHKALNYDKASLKMDKADRALYNSMLRPGQPSDFRGFAANPERDRIYDEYSKETQRIANSKFEKKKLPPKPANMPKNEKAHWSESTQSYWIGNTEYKVK